MILYDSNYIFLFRNRKGFLTWGAPARKLHYGALRSFIWREIGTTRKNLCPNCLLMIPKETRKDGVFENEA